MPRHEITRRDYLNGMLLGAGAGLLRAGTPAETMDAARFDGYGGGGDYGHSNGNTWAVIADGHKIRDSARHTQAATETRERYDCVVVGGGISGLAAALFFTRQAGPRATCLVIEDHAIFGGLAKRNEVNVEGQRVIANQASAMFFPPLEGSFLQSFYRSVGIDPNGWEYQRWGGRDPEMAVGNTPYFGGGKNSAFYFGARFGKTRGVLLTDPFGKRLEGAPISEESRRELLRVHESGEPELPKEHGDALSRHMDSITLEEYLMAWHAISRETVRTFLSPVAGGGAGIGADALSAYAEYAADVLLPWDHSKGVQMFPGGNTGVARHILKALLPEAIAGDATMQGVCRNRVNFGALDDEGQPVRIRLRSTVFSVEPEAAAVKITYLSGGQLYTVRAGRVIMAGGSWTTRHIIPDLPATHREAYGQFHRSPALVANVVVRNWRFLYKLGISECQWFEGMGNYFALRKLATMGDISSQLSPDSPVMLTLKILYPYPGLPLEEQNRRGREELLSTTYARYEKRIVDQLHRMFGRAGLDVGRDIPAIILNRWGHAYLSAQPGFFFGSAGKPGPGEFLRTHPFGRITFANSDLSGIMDHRASILEAHRAVQQAAGRI